MRLVPLRTAILQSVSQKLPALGTCGPTAGRFDVEELAHVALRLPAVLGTVLESPRIQDNGDGQLDVQLRCCLYIVTTASAVDGAALPAADAALNIVETLLQHVQGNFWGLPDVGAPETIRAENLYHERAGGKSSRAAGVCLWAVHWLQPVRLGTAFSAAPSGPIPSELYVGLAPEIGAAHVADYVRVDGEAPL